MGTAGTFVDEVDLCLVGGRVIDPETGLDGVRAVGIRDGSVVHVGTDPVPARRILDVAGLVVAPGFIDLHSHAQSLVGLRLQALDGVTTALELEAGEHPVGRAIRTAESEGRPVNVGFSAGWAAARQTLAGRSTARPADGWDRPWGERDVRRLLDVLASELDDGALGIGILLGYAPQVTRAEYLALARLAHEHDVPAFTHTRFISLQEPDSALEAVLEVVAAAAGTGAHLHLCHVNSTSTRQIEEILEVIGRARESGTRITVEAYPYGSGSTSIGAAFLAPEELGRMGIGPESITYLRTGRRVEDLGELRTLRSDDPDGQVVIDWADEGDEQDRRLLLRSLLADSAAIASDAFTPLRRGVEVPGDEWPLGPDAITHPRSLGCYGKVFRWLVRELGVLTLPEAVRRCTLVPAQVLDGAVPAMRAKGRVQVGCDADLVVFDPRTFADRATYTRPVPSTGVRHLLVHGQLVVQDGELDPLARPGRPVRR